MSKLYRDLMHFHILYKARGWEEDLHIQKDIIDIYKRNPIISDAIDGIQTVEKSLEELASINDKSGWRLFPRFKNRAHNERVYKMKELVDCSHRIEAKGIFAPDNFIAGVGYAMVGAYIAALVSIPILEKAMHVNTSPAEIFQKINYWSSGLNIVMAPLIGLGLQAQRLTNNEPYKKARFLDNKIKEFYH